MVNLALMEFKKFSFGGEDLPLQRLALALTSQSGNIQQGVWECGPGELELNFQWNETVYVLEGRAEVKNLETGMNFVLTPGSMAIFEKGSRWVWQIPWKFKKVFTIIDE